MDKIDRKILYELDLNSRQSFQSLGKKVGLGKETVFHRVQKLKEKGIIDKFITILNIHELDYQNYRLFFKLRNADNEIEQKIINYCDPLPALKVAHCVRNPLRGAGLPTDFSRSQQLSRSE